MTVYLLIVIIGLLINRKLGIFLLVVPVVGVILLLLLAWLSDNEVVRRAFAPVPVPATPSPSDNLTCAERLTPAACAGHAFLVTGFILLSPRATQSRRVDATPRLRVAALKQRSDELLSSLFSTSRLRRVRPSNTVAGAQYAAPSRHFTRLCQSFKCSARGNQLCARIGPTPPSSGDRR